MKKKVLALGMVAALATTAVAGGTLAYFTDVTETKENTFTVGHVDIDLVEPKWDADGLDKHNFMPGTDFEKDPTINLEEKSEESWVFMKVSMNKFNSWLRLVAIQNDEKEINGKEYDLISYKDTDDPCNTADGHCQGHFNDDVLKAFFNEGAFRPAFDEWFKGIKHEEWAVMNMGEVLENIEKSWTDSSIKTVDLILGYKETLIDVEGKNTTGALFTSVEMPETVTTQQLEDSRFNTEKNEWKLDITAYAIQKENIADLNAAYEALFENN